MKTTVSTDISQALYTAVHRSSCRNNHNHSSVKTLCNWQNKHACEYKCVENKARSSV